MYLVLKMNKKLISELALKSYIVVGDYSYCENVLSPDKFAELIVKECMSMCDETQANYLKHRKATIDFDEKNIFAEGEAASHVIKYKMKKHFGIEDE